MKAKYFLVSLLLVALVMSGTGYSVSAGSGDKVTGGGTFEQGGWGTPYADGGDKISFGFNAQGNGAVKGQFHLINHDSGMKISATIAEIIPSTGISVTIKGTCLVDGAPTDFEALLNDGGEGGGGSSWESVTIWLGGTKAFSGQLSKGNIQKHKVK